MVNCILQSSTNSLYLLFATCCPSDPSDPSALCPTGPRLLLNCPCDLTASQVWFTGVWNYSIVPYLVETVRGGPAHLRSARQLARPHPVRAGHLPVAASRAARRCRLAHPPEA